MENNEKIDPRMEQPDIGQEAPAPEVVPETDKDDIEDLPASDEDWDSRVLCSDESCIGVIGSDGRCRECGKPAGPDFTPPSGDRSPDGDKPTVELPEKVAEPQETVDEDLVIADDEWDQRILCNDESCIGVIGSDGCCRECGRPYKRDQ